MTGEISASDVKELRNGIERKKAERELYRKQLKQAKQKFRAANERLKDIKDARIFVQEVAQKTQKNLEEGVSDLVTTAFHSVFKDDPLAFKMQFVSRRNKTECDLFFEKHKKLMEPLFSEAGGAVDIASFALRAAYLQLRNNRKVLLLDEPMKNVSSDYLPDVAEMMRLIATDLGFQIVMVTHIESLYEECADKIFRVRNGHISET